MEPARHPWVEPEGRLFDLTPGQNHRAVLTNNANGLVIADAVRFEPIDALPNRTIWTK
jgi:hypothetical protein